MTGIDSGLMDFLANEGTLSLLAQIQNKYAFSQESKTTNDLGILLTLYVTKLIFSQDLVNELALLVSPKYFKAFMQELEQKLWSPYDRFLLDAGLVYKQLTVLDPQPIEQEATTQAVPTTPSAQTISVPITPATKQTTTQEQLQPKPFIDTFFAPKPTEPQPIEIKTTPADVTPQPVAKPIIPPVQPDKTPAGEARIRFAPSRTTIAHAPEPVAQKPATQEPQLTQIRFTPLNSAKGNLTGFTPAPQPPMATPITQQPTPALAQTEKQKPDKQSSPTLIQLETSSPRTAGSPSGPGSLTGPTPIPEQKQIQKTVTHAQPAQPTSELRKAVIDLSTFGITDSKT